MALKDATLISFIPDLKVLDCTMRDGGLVNNFGFTDEFVKDLYRTNQKAGVDYMEFGYKADKDIFKESDFGKWKFGRDDDIRAIVGENNTDLKISVMADVGRTNYKRDILPRSESPIDMIRVATYITTIPAAIAMLEDCKSKGYETTVNVMAISKADQDDLKNGLRLLAESGVADVIYLVDSFGNFYPEQIEKFMGIYMDIVSQRKIEIGMHGHNNQQLAFANTIQAMMNGAHYLDATVSGMGRGAGNCFLESILGFLKNPKYNFLPITDFVQKHILKLKEEGVVWGYDIPYLMTGLLNAHPSSAINFEKAKRSDYSDFYQELLDDTL